MGRAFVFVLTALALAGSSPLAAAPAASPAPLAQADQAAINLALAAAPARGLPAIAVNANGAADPWRAAAVGYAQAERGRIADPQALDANFALKSAADLGAEFDAARAAGQVQAWLAAQTHDDPDLQALVQARAAYAAVVSAGGWPLVGAGKPPKRGAADARLPALRQRLALEGYAAAPSGPPDRFDSALEAQLAAFQSRHGLASDGVLNAATLEALNTPADERLSEIDANIERARWLPARLPPMRIEVDTGDPQATLYQNGQAVLTMRAIVGKPSTRTPTFASNVVAVKFNPPWIVPAGIAAREILPKERRHPGYLARNDFYVAHGQVIQRPGPKAALGYIKFEIPDSFDVYLHDTPARTLFAKPVRWLSHGCMRIEKPRELAAALLAPQGWNPGAVDAAIAKGSTQSVPLKVQPPVFVVYRTVVPTPDGPLLFRKDVYGWDAKIAAALASRP